MKLYYADRNGGQYPKTNKRYSDDLYSFTILQYIAETDFTLHQGNTHTLVLVIKFILSLPPYRDSTRDLVYNFLSAWSSWVSRYLVVVVVWCLSCRICLRWQIKWSQLAVSTSRTEADIGSGISPEHLWLKSWSSVSNWIKSTKLAIKEPRREAQNKQMKDPLNSQRCTSLENSTLSVEDWPRLVSYTVYFFHCNIIKFLKFLYFVFKIKFI